MKYIFILITLISYSAKCQTWTVNRLRDSVLKINERVAAIQAKQAVKDRSDDGRNEKIKRLEERSDSLVNVVNKMSFIVAGKDFIIDSLTKVIYIRWPTDTVIIKRGN